MSRYLALLLVFSTASLASAQGYTDLFGLGGSPLAYVALPITPADLSDLTGETDGMGGSGDDPAEASYTVVSGDSLSAIASRLCGSSSWQGIFEANRDQIRDPNLIYPGQTLRIPCGASSAAAPAPMVPGPTPGSASGAILGPGRGFLTNLPLPAGSYRKSSGFGPRNSFRTDNGARSSSNHKGVDLSAPSGTPIGAAGPGVVIHAGPAGGYGFAVYIRHANGMVTRYGHLRVQPKVRAGQTVSGGQQIGEVGSTGNSTGPHLHFEVREANGTARNPEHFCKF